MAGSHTGGAKLENIHPFSCGLSSSQRATMRFLIEPISPIVLYPVMPGQYRPSDIQIALLGCHWSGITSYKSLIGTSNATLA